MHAEFLEFLRENEKEVLGQWDPYSFENQLN
jgi:hypothetical protein